MPIFGHVLNLEGSSGLTSILAHLNGIAVKPCFPHVRGLAPDDADRRVILVLDEQIQGGAGGLYTADNISVQYLSGQSPIQTPDE